MPGKFRLNPTRRVAAAAVVAGFLGLAGQPAEAADPIKVGVGLALTGAGAPAGKMLLAALELWRADVNAKGGLLGRPVELIHYDDQSTPANVPGIYAKLIAVDKVDLLLGPYATNFVAPAMPTIIQNNRMTISFTAIGINRHFNYPKYFSMVPVGPDGIHAFSKGFFTLAAEQSPKPQTVAIVAADAEFAKSASEGARSELKLRGFNIVYDQSYPPNATDFAPVMRAVQAANPDIVYVAAYAPDTVGIVRAANEIGLTPKMFGGAMIGLLITPIKVQLGPIMNGIVIGESFLPSPKLRFAGLDDVLARYRAKAAELKTDPLGYGFVPFGYAAGQVLAQAVTETKSLDHDKLAAYLKSHSFKTVVGEISFGKDGEWSKARQFTTQFQNVEPNNLEQFRSGDKQPILWPPEFKTGNLVYPYVKARQK
ncbi:MAG TPA: amino acid ABC transporter substrate-binding protein [Xanthobacteraceae bacterium]|nr:amino acid ABC transporter substrate-binding protein [Xanthobacteraceae bacterium]